MRGGGRGPAAHRPLEHIVEVQALAWQLTLTGPAEHEQLPDDLCEAVHLPRRGVEFAGRNRAHAGRAGLLHPQAQPGQGGTQLVRGVGHKRTLRVEQPLHAVGHLIEGHSQRALLAAPLDRRASA